MIAIIGGSGFIGSSFAKLCVEGAVDDVLIIDKSSGPENVAQTVVADIRDPKNIENAVPEGAIVVHLAAEHQDNVEPLSLYEDVNVQGTRNVCDVARKKNVKTIIFTSSAAVYGFSEEPISESSQINPFNEYGRTKAKAEEVLAAWQAEAPDERSLVIIRPTAVLGEGNRGNVYNLMRQVHSGKFLMIGSGRNRKSLAYVGNVAALLRHCLGLGAGFHLMNYADKPDLSVTEIVGLIRLALGKSQKPALAIPYWIGVLGGLCLDLVSRISGAKFPISLVRVRKFCANTVFSTNVSEIGFSPPTSLDEAITKTVIAEFGERREER